MPDDDSIRGSALTDIAVTARMIRARTDGPVPGGYVAAGRPDVFYLAVCGECEGMVMPFGNVIDRDNWAVAHPHHVSSGVEIRFDPRNL
jgi:hypothetical protein